MDHARPADFLSEESRTPESPKRPPELFLALLSFTMQTPEVVPLRETDVPAAAALLSRAFYNDPLQIYTLPDPVERAERSAALFSAALRYGLLFGEVFTTPALEGVAIWIGPDAWDITEERAAQAGFDRLPGEMGGEATERFFSVLAIGDEPHRRDVRPDHWWVMVLGVAPEAQGRRLARALLEPIMRRADAARQQCYLETANPANIGFYEHMGFERVAEIVHSQSGLRLHTFRHDPPAPSAT
jgi:ribosomal protein S18 acetylase RimI-like enzyme